MIVGLVVLLPSDRWGIYLFVGHSLSFGFWVYLEFLTISGHTAYRDLNASHQPFNPSRSRSKPQPLTCTSLPRLTLSLTYNPHPHSIRARPNPDTAFKPRPAPSHQSLTQGTKQYQLRKYAEQTLGSGNLRNAVVLPEGEEVQEWVAVHGTS